MEKSYGGTQVKFGWQTTQENEWAQYYGYPSYGVGVYSGFLGDPEIFGNPNAVYGFVNFPLSSDHKKNILSVEPALGLTYNLEPYDADNNPLNEAIGAKAAVYASVKLGYNYKINREIDFEYGLDFTHFSNGRLYTPNYGLNMVGIHLGLKYNYSPDQKKLNPDLYKTNNVLPARYLRPHSTPKIKSDDSNSINAYVGGSTVQTYENQGADIRYAALSGIIEYQHKINMASGYTVGLDYFFDGSLAEEFPDRLEKRHHLGIHAGYDFMFYKFTLGVHIGTYLNNNPTKPAYFFRPALRYDIGKRFYGQIGLKTRGFAADWIEFGVGFRPFRWWGDE
ncbi:hypothetical protein GO491_08770 [Flavobacteriaceae bacterium Ap0902]|nr:hypothetical protein [Flavobacteriaceae bacterium Ap0902]